MEPLIRIAVLLSVCLVRQANIVAATQNVCLHSSLSANVGEFQTVDYPRWFSSDNCKCTIVVNSDLSLHLRVIFEVRSESGSCAERVVIAWRNETRRICPQSGSDTVMNLELYARDTTIVALSNEMQSYLRLKTVFSGTPGKQASMNISCDGQVGVGVLESGSVDNSPADRNPENKDRGAINVAVVIVVIIVIVIILVLLAALYKMNLDKKRARKKRALKKSTSTMDDVGINRAYDSSSELQRAYEAASSASRTTDSSPAGFADLGVGAVPRFSHQGSSHHGSNTSVDMCRFPVSYDPDPGRTRDINGPHKPHAKRPPTSSRAAEAPVPTGAIHNSRTGSGSAFSLVDSRPATSASQPYPLQDTGVPHRGSRDNLRRQLDPGRGYPGATSAEGLDFVIPTAESQRLAPDLMIPHHPDPSPAQYGTSHPLNESEYRQPANHHQPSQNTSRNSKPIPKNAFPLTQIPSNNKTAGQNGYPTTQTYAVVESSYPSIFSTDNSGIYTGDIVSLSSDAESARFMTAPSSPLDSPVDVRRTTETSI